ncbi:MAG: hypothetical protein KKA79_04180 [Nanoarchaeota archaeon]|nr:hypothetical protein [Nanoarchaeota archaeon]MCG2718137.1 hypothetical protein [Nanoarchaeota archaeon]
MGNQPIKKWRSGNISGAIWFNEREFNGEKKGFKTATLRRSWKKEGDVWRDETINLRRQDIPKLITILNKIQEELYLTEEGDEE